jgi:2-polyprenyl-3-methyl-5-hydroxy-6-metoxy-1,4-benzoquinol methylase
MQNVIEKYAEVSFDVLAQSQIKIKEFEHNYGRYLNKTKNFSALDVGVGLGEMLECFQNRYIDYLGIDISQSTINFCKKYNCIQVPSVSKWLVDNPKKFSLITCLDVLEHVPKDEINLFLRALYNALDKDGTLILQVPNLQSPFGYLHHFNDLTHVNGFVEHSLEQLFKSNSITTYSFFPYEHIVGINLKSTVKKFLRSIFYSAIKFLRAIDCCPNPKIITPIIYAVIKKH